MTARYHARESRPEDLRHIEQLQQRLSETETQKKRAVVRLTATSCYAHSCCEAESWLSGPVMKLEPFLTN